MRVLVDLVRQLLEYRSAKGQVTHVILERREAGHHSSVNTKRWDSVGDALLGLGDKLQDCGSKSLKDNTLTRWHSL